MQAQDAGQAHVMMMLRALSCSRASCLPRSSHMFPHLMPTPAEVWIQCTSIDKIASNQSVLACLCTSGTCHLFSTGFAVMHKSLFALVCDINRRVSVVQLSTRVPRHPNNHPWERKSLCSALLYSFPITSQVSQS